MRSHNDMPCPNPAVLEQLADMVGAAALEEREIHRMWRECLTARYIARCHGTTVEKVHEICVGDWRNSDYPNAVDISLLARKACA